jgi:hypothetical protein
MNFLISHSNKRRNNMEEYTERNYLCDKETYLTMKKDQKMLAGNKEADKLKYNYNFDYYVWLERKPIKKDNITFETLRSFQEEWRKQEPQKPHFMAIDARSMNIVYSMIKGKSYSQVEQKVREHNEPSKYQIGKICSLYNIDINKLEGINYGRD